MMTREEWLNELTYRLRPVFQDLGYPLPEKLRASCGWPSKGALSKKKRVVAQCWYPECSADGTTEVFVSPVRADGHTVAEDLAHELVHAAAGPGHGHKGLFITIAKALGFTAPWKQTPATPELANNLHGLADLVGQYPHATLDSMATEAGGGDKPGGTRLLKAQCEACGYTIRLTKKWAEKGLPICPCNMKPMAGDIPAGQEEDEPEQPERLAA